MSLAHANITNGNFMLIIEFKTRVSIRPWKVHSDDKKSASEMYDRLIKEFPDLDIVLRIHNRALIQVRGKLGDDEERELRMFFTLLGNGTGQKITYIPELYSSEL